jgi:DNA-binding Xre family transcriptional regulator
VDVSALRERFLREVTVRPQLADALPEFAEQDNFRCHRFGTKETRLCCSRTDSILSLAMTKLEEFLKANDVKPARLAREAGISRQQLLRIRFGKAEVKMKTALRIRDACGRLTSRRVNLGEIFDLAGTP